MDKNNNTPSDLVSYTQLFIIIATFLSPLGLFLFGVDISKEVIGGFIFLLLIIAVTFFLLWRKAQTAYLQNDPLPPPSIFWKIIFNKLTPVKGDLKDKQITYVLVVYDNSTAHHFEELRLNFDCSEGNNNDLQLIPFDWSNPNPNTSLFNNLNESQALYLFWTKEIARDKNFRETLDKWSALQTHKPVLAVNLNDKHYELPFDVVPVAEAGTGLWRLLSKSVERTILWHQQATAYRKFWFGTLFLLIALFITSGFFFYQNSNAQSKLKRRDQILPNQSLNVARRLQALREKLGTRSSNNTNSNANGSDNLNLELKAELQKTLNDYTKFSYDELMHRIPDAPLQGGHISLWRLSPDKTFFQQVARSEPNEDFYRTFKAEENTIIRCAIEKNAFVLWKNNFAQGEAASWNINDEIIGNWKNGNINFDPVKYIPPTCNRTNIDDDDKTTGLLCLGVNSMPLDKNIKNAICLDVPHQNTEFLQEPGTRNYLLQTIAVMHLIPDELLNFKMN